MRSELDYLRRLAVDGSVPPAPVLVALRDQVDALAEDDERAAVLLVQTAVAALQQCRRSLDTEDPNILCWMDAARDFTRLAAHHARLEETA